jgi:hypothetical protein
MDKKEKTEEACTCNEGNCCCCCKCNKKVFKILGLIIIFLAGMGFDSLLNPAVAQTKALVRFQMLSIMINNQCPE